LKIGSNTDLYRISDPAIKRVAETNLQASHSSVENPYLLAKQFGTKSLASSTTEFTYQSSIFQQNEAILDLLCYKTNAISSKAFKTSQEGTTGSSLGSLPLVLSVLDAVGSTNNEADKSSVTKLLSRLKMNPTNLGLVLALAQLQISFKNYSSAISTIETYIKNTDNSTKEASKNVGRSPGVIALLVSLYRSQGRHEAAKQALIDSLPYWLKEKSGELHSALQYAGRTLLKYPDTIAQSAAKEIYDTLRSQQPDSRETIAGTLASRTEEHKVDVKTESGSKSLSKITPISKLVAGLDVKQLEAAGVAQPPADRQQAKKRSAAEDLQKPAKKKRVRPSKSSKEIDPSKPLDPDRWLPLRDRASYNPKGKKNKAKAAAATQGGFDDSVKEKVPVDSGKVDKAPPSIGAKRAKGKKGKK
jgi:signal recognition particle subunit SRP72